MITAILIAYFHSKHFPRGPKGVVVRDCQSLKLEFLRTEKGEKINFFHFSKLPRGLQGPLISPARSSWRTGWCEASLGTAGPACTGPIPVFLLFLSFGQDSGVFPGGSPAGLEGATSDLSAPVPPAGAWCSFVQILTAEGQNGPGPQAILRGAQGGRGGRGCELASPIL